jgi:hypothetical protein
MRVAEGRLTGVAMTVNFVRARGAAQVNTAVPGLGLSVSARERTETLAMLMRESLRNGWVAALAPGAMTVTARAASVVPVSVVAMVSRVAPVSELSMSNLPKSLRGGSAASAIPGMCDSAGWGYHVTDVTTVKLRP